MDFLEEYDTMENWGVKLGNIKDGLKWVLHTKKMTG